MTSTDMVVREGTNVTMVCRATGYPEPYVMWRREDGQEFNCNGESGEFLYIYTIKHLETDSNRYALRISRLLY